jgi:hypothetical protein
MDRVAQAAPPPRVHRLDVAAKRQRKIAILDGLANFPLKVHMPMIIQTHEDESRKGWKTGNISVLALSTYLESRFSIHPPGDSLTRRGFYESVLMGCIPVVPSEAYARHYTHMLWGATVRNISFTSPIRHSTTQRCCFNIWT